MRIAFDHFGTLRQKRLCLSFPALKRLWLLSVGGVPRAGDEAPPRKMYPGYICPKKVMNAAKMQAFII